MGVLNRRDFRLELDCDESCCAGCCWTSIGWWTASGRRAGQGSQRQKNRSKQMSCILCLISGVAAMPLATPDSSESPNVGAYESTMKKTGITVNTKHFVFKTDPNDVNFLVEISDNNSGQDNYLLRSYNNLPLANGAPVEHIAWQLDDPTQTAVSSDALPTTAPTLADYQSIFGLTVQGEDLASGDPFFIRAHVTKVS
jgi:hypothetical protein